MIYPRNLFANLINLVGVLTTLTLFAIAAPQSDSDSKSGRHVVGRLVTFPQTSDPRDAWDSNSYNGIIEQHNERTWIEYDKATGRLKVELEFRRRTDEYVEMYNPEHKELIRLYADRMEAQSEGQWKRIGTGSWTSKRFSKSNNSTSQPERSKRALETPIPLNSPKKENLHIENVYLDSVVAATGKQMQAVRVQLRNLGKRTIRVIDGVYLLKDAQGNTLRSIPYTIMSDSDNQPGLLPGQSKIVGGLLIPKEWNVSTALLEITTISELQYSDSEQYASLTLKTDLPIGLAAAQKDGKFDFHAVANEDEALTQLNENYLLRLDKWKKTQSKIDALNSELKLKEELLAAEYSKINYGPKEQPLREWVSTDGKHKTQATIIDSDYKSATLRKNDGSEITVPKTKLCEGDRIVVEKYFVEREILRKKSNDMDKSLYNSKQEIESITKQIRDLKAHEEPIKPTLEYAKRVYSEWKKAQNGNSSGTEKMKTPSDHGSSVLPGNLRFISFKEDPKTPGDLMYLFWSPAEKMNQEQIVECCKVFRERFSGRRFSYLVVFDLPENAKYPSQPFTSLFGIEAEKLRHIRAIYEHNKLNGYSELRLYDSNAWEGHAKQIRIP